MKHWKSISGLFYYGTIAFLLQNHAIAQSSKPLFNSYSEKSLDEMAAYRENYNAWAEAGEEANAAYDRIAAEKAKKASPTSKRNSSFTFTKIENKPRLSDAQIQEVSSYIQNMDSSPQAGAYTQSGATRPIALQAKSIQDIENKILRFKLSLDEKSGEIKISGLIPRVCVSGTKIIIHERNESTQNYAVTSTVSNSTSCTSDLVKSCTRSTCLDAATVSDLLTADIGASIKKTTSGVKLLKSGELIFRFEDDSFPAGDPDGISETAMDLVFIDQATRDKAKAEEEAYLAEISAAETCVAAEEGNLEAILALENLGASKTYIDSLKIKFAEKELTDLESKICESKSLNDFESISEKMKELAVNHPEMSKKIAASLLHLSVELNTFDPSASVDDASENANVYLFNKKKYSLTKKFLSSARKLDPKNETYFIASKAVSLDEAKNAAENSNDPRAYSLARYNAYQAAQSFGKFYTNRAMHGKLTAEIENAADQYRDQLYNQQALPQTPALIRNGMMLNPLSTVNKLDSTFLVRYNAYVDQKQQSAFNTNNPSQQVAPWFSQNNNFPQQNPMNLQNSNHTPGF